MVCFFAFFMILINYYNKYIIIRTYQSFVYISLHFLNFHILLEQIHTPEQAYYFSKYFGDLLDNG